MSVADAHMTIQNIPHEMRAYRQWICWKYDTDDKGKPTKLPMSPAYRGQMASVSKPDTWSDFNTAAKLYLDNTGVYAGIGFILTENDPYCFIDLDDAADDFEIYQRQRKVFDNFETYAEFSPSGKGLHLICKAKVPSGRKRSKIEIYSSARFMTMTGNIFKDRNISIAECQDMALTLFGQMGKNDVKGYYDPKAPQTQSDEQIKQQACDAANGDLFLDLDRGDWQNRYASQSEADQALINILAYHTQNREQIIRMFRASGLGQRDKAKRSDYMKYTINKAFDMNLPPVDLEGMAEIAKMLVADRIKQESNAANGDAPPIPQYDAPTQAEVTGAVYAARGEPVPYHMANLPSGLVGEIANFVFEQSPRSVPEAALAASFGMLSGMIGRCFNVSGSGLNQYILFLARTGAGKEAISSGIDKILTQAQQSCPLITEFFGPSDIASGQALAKYITEFPSFVSIVGEFDNKLKQMCAPNANGAMLALRQNILKYYQQSGQGRTARKTIYSDSDKSTKDVKSPSFSLLGECTPDLLFANVDDELIASGLLPRFTIFEYRGKINYINEKSFSVKPPKFLVDKIAQLAEICHKMNDQNQVVDVQMSPQAKSFFDAFSRECTDQINNHESLIAGNLWNRAHLKAIKIAATIAVGTNPWQPIIDIKAATYGRELILYDVRNLLRRYETGGMGKQTEESKQFIEIKKAIKRFLTHNYDGTLNNYGVKKKMHDFRVIPGAFFSRYLNKRSCFRNDPMKANFSIKRAIKQMIDEGIIQELGKQQAAEVFDTSQVLYTISDVNYIMNWEDS